MFDVDVSKLDFKIRDMINEYLKILISRNGSDLHVKANGLIRGRINGEVEILGDKILSKDDMLILAKELLRTNFKELVEKRSIDFIHNLDENFRFRVNVFFQVDGVSAVFRTIPTNIPTMQEINLPKTIQNIATNTHRGLVLVTGPTGSGKSTTLASMIQHINATQKRHIITIEDPIEFIHKDNLSIINQRSVGQDVANFAEALRAALREDPDVILVGEMRDLQTIEMAMSAAQTGHLVLATMHTIDAKESINRIVSMFDTNEQNRIRVTLASTLVATISQRLVKTINEKRTAAIEILINNARTQDIILNSNDHELFSVMQESKNFFGMQTFDMHLLELFANGTINADEALKNATRANDLKIQIKNLTLKNSTHNDIIALKDLS
ncbi:type IV pilus twitching motility protein PilT [Campylobacter majalis]|uniref:type IV pilus twitching motility protein PilT n=1 Tax=Campylobacter majalis TaxID=2790656 RepID=UPI003D69C9B8